MNHSVIRHCRAAATSFVLAAAAFAAADPATNALLSADELVPMLSAGAPAGAPTDPRDLLDEIIALREDGPARRDPDLRAARWLELAARAEALGFGVSIDPDQSWMRGGALPAAVRHLVAALPPPSRWPAMREALDARAAAADPTNQPPALSALRLSLARLSGDAAASSNALAALLAAPGQTRGAARGDKTKALRKAVFSRDRPYRPRGEAVFRVNSSADPAEEFTQRVSYMGNQDQGLFVADADLDLSDDVLGIVLTSGSVRWMRGSDAARARLRELMRANTRSPATAETPLAWTLAAWAPVAWALADATPDGLAYFAERRAARNAPDAWADALARHAEKGPDVLMKEPWARGETDWSSSDGRRKKLGTIQPPPEAMAYLRAVATLCGRDLAAGRVAAADARLDEALPEAIRPAVALAAAALSVRDPDAEGDWPRRPASAPAVADFVARRALPPAAPATADAVGLFVRLDPPSDDAAAARLDALAARLEADPAVDAKVLAVLAAGRLEAALAAGRFDDAAAAARRMAEQAQEEKEEDLRRWGCRNPFTFARAVLAAGETNRLEEALALAHAMAAASKNPKEFRHEEAELLASAGRAAEAQSIYARDLAETIREFERERNAQPFVVEAGGHWETMRDLEPLVELYLDAGRSADALALFERVPFWGVADAKDLGYASLLRTLARALDGVGRADDAARIARYAVEELRFYGNDWPWEILIERLPADEFLALAERVRSIDPWEERPVQWKAEALRRAGRLDEAEAAARLALKIDPTDGEAPPGDRIRSYAILASVLEAKGGEEAAKEAATLRSVVAAVRLAEKGDELAEAGLVSLALEAYDDAAGLFSDAYCVQWRLAERLRERGFPELAAAHYEETFRRMPEQFGRVASLCFGCAGVFDSGESVSAAERILPELAARPGALPATHRLLGMLRSEQKRYGEAWDAFRAALEADPGYLDAVRDLLALRGKVVRPRADWESVQRRAVELDPLGLHVRIEARDVLDWTMVREANAAALANLPDPPAALFPLPASAAALAAASKPRKDAWEYGHVSTYGPEGETIAARSFDAARAFASLDNPPTWLTALCEWLSAAGGGR